MAGRMAIRVVVTGVGVVSPIGIGNDRFWDSLVSNRTGIDFVSAMYSIILELESVLVSSPVPRLLCLIQSPWRHVLTSRYRALWCTALDR